jgi:hypothetical protein
MCPTGQIVAFLQPGHIVDNGVGPRFDTAVIAIDRFILADPSIPGTIGFLLESNPEHPIARRLGPDPQIRWRLRRKEFQAPIA